MIRTSSSRQGNPRTWCALAALGVLLSGCSGASDLLSKDAEWFSRPSRMFNQSLVIETPPLSPTRALTPDDMISADGYCSGMGAPAEANAMSDVTQQSSTGPASVALGSSECEVARFIGAPDNVNLSNNDRGDRVAVLTYTRGTRPGAYRFTGGRLTEVEGVAQAPAERPAKGKPRKRAG